jgi:hypothetical protein
MNITVHPDCYLVMHGVMVPHMTPCEGRLIKVHLIAQQTLKREGLRQFLDDPAVWVWGCGGIMGITGHHGHLDSSKRLRIYREALPVATREFAVVHGLEWYLDRYYPRV